MMPHSPHTPPTASSPSTATRPPSLEVAKYWAMCEWFDETCGVLLDHLGAKGLADDTMVVYLADNGWIQAPAADRPRAEIEAVALRRRRADADRRELAGEGQARDVGPAGHLDRPRARRSSPPPG